MRYRSRVNTSPPTVNGLLAAPGLRLISRLAGSGCSEPLDWVHSSDLTDPTPFLTGHTMLLTTGTQFPAEDDDRYYAAYADRLVAAGVVAVGFGLEVIRDGTPAALVTACAERDITLVEVPYEVPFIALIRWVADRITARERERDAWTLAAQRAVSVAALTTGTLDGIVRVLAEQVGGEVMVFGADGEIALHEPRSGSRVHVAALEAEALRMLARRTRASAEVPLPSWSGFATVQTLGPRGALRGAIAVVGRGRNDLALQAVVTSAVAIAEVLLGRRDEEHRLERRIAGMIVTLMLDGHVSAADAIARELGRSLPEPLRVGVLGVGQPSGLPGGGLGRVPGARAGDPAADAGFVDAIEALSHLLAPWSGVVGARAGSVVFLVEDGAEDALRTAVANPGILQGVAIGLSETLEPDQAAAGLAQATRMLAVSAGGVSAGAISAGGVSAGGVFVFGMATSGVLDGLWAAGADAVADRRLAVLAGEPGDLVACARVWLAHNGHWESAAREAGLHRHTLKARVNRVAVLLRLDLDQFAGRAELWALLEASRAGS